MFDRCTIPAHELADLVDGRLTGERAQQLTAHLARCEACRHQVEWIHRLTSIMRSDDSVEPPAWVLERTKRLFQTPRPRPWPHLVERVIAALVLDSRQAFQPVGLRQTAAHARRLLYQTPDVDVDLHIEPGDQAGEFTLLGQVLPSMPTDALPAAEALLLRGRRKLSRKPLDPLGEFAFGPITPGTYTIRITLGGREIELSHLEIP